MNGLKTIYLKIKFHGPFYFGAGKDQAVGTDLSFYRLGGKLTIPGSAIKGELRTAIKKFCKGIHDKYQSNDFSNVETCTAIFDEENPLHRNSYQNCPICKVFGWNNFEGKLRFLDFELNGETHELLNQRNVIQLDRILNSTKPQMLMSFEFIEMDNEKEFDIKIPIIVIKNLTEIQYTILHYCVKMITKLGGLGSRGVGRVEKAEMEFDKTIEFEKVIKKFLGE